eukprot:914361-Amphidinium_carterae.1
MLQMWSHLGHDSSCFALQSKSRFSVELLSRSLRTTLQLLQDPLSAVDVQHSVQAGLLEMGFLEADIQRARHFLGLEDGDVEIVLQVLLALHEEGAAG